MAVGKGVETQKEVSLLACDPEKSVELHSYLADCPVKGSHSQRCSQTAWAQGFQLPCVMVRLIKHLGFEKMVVFT